MADTFRGIITADGKKRQLPYGSVLETPVANKTLDIEGAFADAKVVGDNFKKAKAETDSLKEDLANQQKPKTCTTTLIERGDILYLVQNIYDKLQRAVNKLPKNCISISSLRSCRG